MPVLVPAVSAHPSVHEPLTVSRQEDVHGWRDVVVGTKEVPDGR
ncbi:MAG: hypothetical protein OXF75_01020 [Acidimicrobiaceae bacterium]|nr:hypothetical protein [Acidimicrobiaceae bacterium]